MGESSGGRMGLTLDLCIYNSLFLLFVSLGWMDSELAEFE